jgi:hypothetical protein
MNFGSKFAMTLVGAAISASMCSADTLPTHRIPAALAIEAASETIAACARAFVPTVSRKECRNYFRHAGYAAI